MSNKEYRKSGNMKILLKMQTIINLLEVQYSISINWLLILILIIKIQIHEIVKIQNSVMKYINLRKSLEIQTSLIFSNV